MAREAFANCSTRLLYILCRLIIQSINQFFVFAVNKRNIANHSFTLRQRGQVGLDTPWHFCCCCYWRSSCGLWFCWLERLIALILREQFSRSCLVANVTTMSLTCYEGVSDMLRGCYEETVSVEFRVITRHRFHLDLRSLWEINSNTYIALQTIGVLLRWPEVTEINGFSTWYLRNRATTSRLFA